MKGIRIGFAIVTVLAITGVIIFSAGNEAPQGESTREEEIPLKETITPQQEESRNVSIDEEEAQTTDILIVNKQNPISPLDFVPDLTVPNVRLRLDPSAEQMKIDSSISGDIEAMFTAAKNDGVSLVFGSGYRSASKQKQFYDSYVARDGQAAADTYSARPGHSEHQTGLSFDVTTPSGTCHLEICFGDTPEGEWMAANAHKHGFILRYPEGDSAITGYQYEPWHFRHVGKDAASDIFAADATLEEYLSLPPAASY